MSGKQYVAVYMRISVEDKGFFEESNSITNQRVMIQAFIRSKKEFESEEVIEFYDDGYSGSNFLRPAIQQLFKALKKGEVHTVIVKDFSRFSRDYIELGSYLEQIFPFMGVRFISISDGYDSSCLKENMAGLDVAFKSILADFYCKDISEKVKASLEVKKSSGQYANGSEPFGYYKDSGNRNQLLVQKEEAEVVRDIFLWTEEGKRPGEIAGMLNQKQVPTPAMFKQKRKTPDAPVKTYVWSIQVVQSILKNEVYIGTFIYSKYKVKEIGSKKSRLIEKEKWKRIENHHQAIIDPKVFQKVNSYHLEYTRGNCQEV
ncbi:recombinase family protein [Anaeromicropila populeti]|uniref:Site-specific DNA recombinase n=1 Tax=Anaeromicropila populeti TaxID=37658 RepID=A0A1I6HIL3_9FIRM|nr:recombinase family protein [Anaeromicropila populeti]SFR54238.1 Site-specific DNA recombinase [Anaeromicropila populeti]